MLNKTKHWTVMTERISNCQIRNVSGIHEYHMNQTFFSYNAMGDRIQAVAMATSMTTKTTTRRLQEIQAVGISEATF